MPRFHSPFQPKRVHAVMQITTALALYHRQLQADGRSPHTVSSYMRDLRLRAAHLGDVDIRAVTPDHIARFILSDAVQKQADGTPKAAISVNHPRTTVRMFMRYLVETAVLERSPAAALKVHEKPGPEPVPDPAITDDDQTPPHPEPTAWKRGTCFPNP